jgi:hypothetical protein
VKRRVLTTAALILGPFAIISLAVQSATDDAKPQPPRTCVHHAHVTTTVYAKNSPEGAPPITYRKTRTWCDEWSR